MTKANEELADLRISVADLATEVTCLKGNSRAANSAEAEANANDQTGVKRHQAMPQLVASLRSSWMSSWKSIKPFVTWLNVNLT